VREKTGRIDGMRSATGRVAFMGNHKSRWLDPTAYYTQLRSDFEGKRFPDSDMAPRNPWKKKITGLRSRCVNAVESREHARLRNSQNASCPLSIGWVE